MKNILFSFVLLFLLTSLLTGCKKNQVIIANVEEINESFLVVENDDNTYKVDLNYDFVVKDHNGKKMSKSDFKVGQKLEISHNGAFLTSYPYTVANISYIKILEE